LADVHVLHHCINVLCLGRILTFDVPFSPQAIKFTRNSVDEENDAICDYGLPIFFYFFTLKHFFHIFNSILLEKKILFICPDLRVLSSVVLSLLPLLGPFSWQSIWIPILPSHLISLLDAPLPYILGVPRLPNFKLPSDVTVVELDLHTGTSQISGAINEMPPFPKKKELDFDFTKVYGELTKTYIRGQVPYLTTSKQFRLSKSIVSIFDKHLSKLFSNFEFYCIRDLTESSTPITVFIKDAFLEHASIKQDLNWFKEFMDTQMFFHYQDIKVRKADAKSKRIASEILEENNRTQ